MHPFPKSAAMAFALAFSTVSWGTAATQAPPHREAPGRCSAETGEIAVPGHAMSVISSRDGCILYVSVSGNGPALSSGAPPRNGVAILRMKDRRFTQTGFLPLKDEPAQMALSPGGQRLYVADNRAGIVEAQIAATGTLTLRRYLLPQLHGGFFQIALSPKGDVLYGGAMKIDRVVAVPLATPDRFTSAQSDHFPVGLALSQDGRFLYVTNAVAVDPAHPKFHPVKCSYRTDPARLDVVPDEGTLQVFDSSVLARGGHAQVARVRAACAPVRVALDEVRGIVWMTARESDVLLGYRVADVLHATRTVPLLVRTGKSPVGLAVNAAGGILAVGNSARFEKQQHRQAAAIYTVRGSRSGLPALVKQEGVGAFPRDISIGRNGTTMYVANFGSSSVTVIHLDSKP